MNILRLPCVVAAALALSHASFAQYSDDYISTEATPTVIDLGGDLVYVFSNKSDVGVARTVTAQKAFTLKEALLVGGGGAGGAVLGGGGGGGQVLAVAQPLSVASSAALTVTVGAGGTLNGWNGGNNGGHTSVLWPDATTSYAYGGGGGGGFSANGGGRPAAVTGEIGSGGGAKLDTTSGSTKGTHYNYGNRGGSYQGGGGGAASPGENGGVHSETELYDSETTYRKQAGYGGEGLTNFIVGGREVYGSGGGGGGGQTFWSQKHAPGGTHAGAGATRSDKSGGGDGTRDALSADAGFGGGGGGGSYSQTGGGGSNPASAGACGTVILRVVKSAATYFSIGPVSDVVFEQPLALPKPAFVTNAVTGVALVEGTDYTLHYDPATLTELGAPCKVTLTVSGKVGTAYEGYENIVTFIAIPNKIAVAAVADQLWLGSDVTPALTVTDPDRGTTLVAGTDYTVAYSGNGQPSGATATATATVSGKAGTRYAGLTVAVNFTVHAPTFTMAAIPGKMYLGSPVEPSVTITRDFDGATLTQGTDFTVAYANNNAAGTATATASGKAGSCYADYSSAQNFNILAPSYQDDYIMASTANLTPLSANGNIVYVFNDVAAGEVAFGFRQQVTLERTLTVGGGGGGGGCVAGAGGGGGVIARAPVMLLASGTSGALQVGAGGIAGAASDMNAGGNGGHSHLVLGTLDDHAYGGGGGGSYKYQPGQAAVTGEIGSGGGNGQKGGTTTADGTWYNSTQGNRGGMVTCGGGGGAGKAASGNVGGEGVTNDITGVSEVYGSGGGGGAGNGNNVNGSVGGTHGGRGTSQGSSNPGGDGDDGFGAGGGGGGYGANRQPVTAGGKGGSGVVVLAFQLGDRTQYRFGILPIADQYYTMSAIEPTIVVSNPVMNVVLTRGTDYEVSYSDNVAVGMAYVTATGKAGTPYAGFVAQARFNILAPTFRIEPIVDQLYLGEPVAPEATVLRNFDGNALEEGVDYTLVYENNDEPGTATVTATGMSGTAYEGLSACRDYLIKSPTFSILPIGSQLYLGKPVLPEITVVRDHDDVVLTKDADFTVAYSDNDAVGTATVTATGVPGTVYEDLSATRTFTINATWYDDNLATDDMSMQKLTVGNRKVYVFTNVASVANVSIRQTMTLKDALLVGGGGAGGSVIGGGGGGGGVVTLAVERVCFEGTKLGITVGRGGTPAAANNWTQAGSGAASSMTVNALPYLEAYGGGGGGGYSCTSFQTGKWGSSGGGGGNNNPSIIEGAHWTRGQGNPGALRVDSNLGGGGGGAYRAGSRSVGGEGLTNAITGVAEVYGSGGGGGSRSGSYSGKDGSGGTHAGRGGENTGLPGENGFGAGGGAGSYKGNASYAGGRGGSGVVILAFEVGGEVGQPEIKTAEIDFPYDTTQPRATVTIGGAKAKDVFSADVTVEMGTAPDALDFTKTFTGVVNGDELSVLGDFSPAKGSTIYLRVTVEAEGASVRTTNVTAVATNDPSPYAGRGGGAGVIHVRAAATGRGDGSDWFNAYTNFREALKAVSEARTEVWLAGDESAQLAHPTFAPAAACTIRGGFGGLEMSAAERDPSAYSTLTGSSEVTGLPINNAVSVTVERFRFRQIGRGLSKSGNGDLFVTNCVFRDISQEVATAVGASVSGSGATARFVDVRFDSLYLGGTATLRSGAALCASGLKRLVLDSCLFVSNGVPFSGGSGDNRAYCLRGAAVYASSAPVTARNCRFTGNRCPALYSKDDSASGGTVYLTGASGGSAFTNCVFAANESVHGYGTYTGEFALDANAGVMTLNLASAAQKVDVVNCTFAYGLVETRKGTAGINVHAGTLNLLNTILFGHVTHPSNAAGCELWVQPGAVANVAYSRFTSNDVSFVSCEEGGTLNLGAGVTYGDPLFVAPRADFAPFVEHDNSGNWWRLVPSKQNELIAWANVHLRGRRGYVDEKTGKVVKFKGVQSPAIDAGDPASDYSREPSVEGVGTNGKRVNLGAYGNTPWATMSPRRGAFLIIR